MVKMTLVMLFLWQNYKEPLYYAGNFLAKTNSEFGGVDLAREVIGLVICQSVTFFCCGAPGHLFPCPLTLG